MKYRLPDGRQVQKKLRPAWTERGRPPAGYFTKRLGEDTAAEYFSYIEHDRGRKPSTLRRYCRRACPPTPAPAIASFSTLGPAAAARIASFTTFDPAAAGECSFTRL